MKQKKKINKIKPRIETSEQLSKVEFRIEKTRINIHYEDKLRYRLVYEIELIYFFKRPKTTAISGFVKHKI